MNVENWILSHPFWATLPISFIMAYCAIIMLEYKGKKEYPDEYVKMSKKQFVLSLILGGLAVNCLILLFFKVSILTLIVIIGLPFALISIIAKSK